MLQLTYYSHDPTHATNKLNRPPTTPVPTTGAPARRPVHPAKAHPEASSPSSQPIGSTGDNDPVYKVPAVPGHPYGTTPPTAGVPGRISPAGQHYTGYPPQNQQLLPGATPFVAPNGILGYPSPLPGAGAGYPPVDHGRRPSDGYPPVGYPNNMNHGYPPQQFMQTQLGYPPQFNTGYPPQMNNFNNGYPPILNNSQSGYPPMNIHNNNLYPPMNNGIGPGGLYPPALPPRPASAPGGSGYPPVGYPFAAPGLYPPGNIGGGYPPQPQGPSSMPRAESPSGVPIPGSVTNGSTFNRNSAPGTFPGSFPGAFPEDSNNILSGHKQSINNGQGTGTQPFSPTFPGGYPRARSASPPALPPRK
ncbi:hypothetical protein B0O80DRAFT_54988 [Mortierella sp. GBAus27b]|nr:hypothetical protein B0O80DRAFT_54988 [Mortierella sp. GBAus27b]